MATASNKCLRRHPRMEVGVRERRPVRHIIQVGPHASALALAPH
jgi:hypothetical protein